MRATGPTPRRLLNIIAGLALVLAAGASVAAQSPDDLRSLSLEDLGNIQVTTVSRTPDTVAHAPAAVFVITQDDIRRSGATSIPEALRLAPGVQVARIDSTHWSIGIRGFAGELARSMLVLIDGRAVYSPLFAGTYWDVQDTLLEDIDRIEVVRGPGGTLWGANAIDGIINIITKPANETQGGLAAAQGGSGSYGSGGFRYGGTSNNVGYRVYGKAVHRGSAFHADGSDEDHVSEGQGGFRVDRALASGRTFTLQGDAYRDQSGEVAVTTSYASPFTTTSPFDATLSGANVLTRWSSAPTAKNGFQLQAYYSRTNRDEVPVTEGRDTFDVDFQQTWKQGPRQDLVFGAGYRGSSGRITAVAPTLFTPATRTDQLWSGFVQDQIALVPDRWRVEAGAKLEHNSYSGVEVQPSGRLLWTPNATHTLVWSVTRAVRTPSRVETDYATATFAGVSGLPIFVVLQPNPAFKPEKLVAYEMEYRIRPAAPLYVTFSSFYNSLNDVESTELLTPFLDRTPPPHLVLPVFFGNGLHGGSDGAEVTADIRATPWWRVTANYSYLRIALSRNAGSDDVSAEKSDEGLSPHHQWQIRSSLDLPHRWSADAFVRYISALPAGPVPSYTTSVVRIAWRVTPHLEVAAIGQDLNQAHHLEWTSGAEVPRSGHATMTWTW